MTNISFSSKDSFSKTLSVANETPPEKLPKPFLKSWSRNLKLIITLKVLVGVEGSSLICLLELYTFNGGENWHKSSSRVKIKEFFFPSTPKLGTEDDSRRHHHHIVFLPFWKWYFLRYLLCCLTKALNRRKTQMLKD